LERETQPLLELVGVEPAYRCVAAQRLRDVLALGVGGEHVVRLWEHAS
jgi:hypothetical protein